MKRKRSYRRGLMAEWFALAWLIAKGYRFVAWRYKTKLGEIDLIVRTRRHLVMVEVKARADASDAAHAVHATNQSRVVQSAQWFLASHPAYQHLQVRFDVVLIAWYKRPKHLRHAFGDDH